MKQKNSWLGGGDLIKLTQQILVKQIKLKDLNYGKFYVTFLLLNKLIKTPDLFFWDTSQPKIYSREIFSILKELYSD